MKKMRVLSEDFRGGGGGKTGGLKPPRVVKSKVNALRIVTVPLSFSRKKTSSICSRVIFSSSSMFQSFQISKLSEAILADFPMGSLSFPPGFSDLASFMPKVWLLP